MHDHNLIEGQAVRQHRLGSACIPSCKATIYSHDMTAALFAKGALLLDRQPGMGVKLLMHTVLISLFDSVHSSIQLCSSDLSQVCEHLSKQGNDLV